MILACVLAMCAGCETFQLTNESLEAKIAEKHTILVSDWWGGGHRMIFEFNGRKGWIVEPDCPRADRPWVWTMQWMGAFLDRTGSSTLVKNGFYHVHLEAFETRCDERGLVALSEFQDYLTGELGLAPKARLIGMSWGGFYSIRYASTYPERVLKIYLDAPLLDLQKFGNTGTFAPTKGARWIGPWASLLPEGGSWSNDPRMPVNRAEPIAKAGIPIILLYGGQDQTVDPRQNCELFADRFRAAGGVIDVYKRGGYGHHPHGFEYEDVPRILRFFDCNGVPWRENVDKWVMTEKKRE